MWSLSTYTRLPTFVFPHCPPWAKCTDICAAPACRAEDFGIDPILKQSLEGCEADGCQVRLHFIIVSGLSCRSVLVSVAVVEGVTGTSDRGHWRAGPPDSMPHYNAPAGFLADRTCQTKHSMLKPCPYFGLPPAASHSHGSAVRLVCCVHPAQTCCFHPCSCAATCI
jgi:hypothetical protein